MIRARDSRKPTNGHDRVHVAIGRAPRGPSVQLHPEAVQEEEAGGERTGLAGHVGGPGARGRAKACDPTSTDSYTIESSF